MKNKKLTNPTAQRTKINHNISSLIVDITPIYFKMGEDTLCQYYEPIKTKDNKIAFKRKTVIIDN